MRVFRSLAEVPQEFSAQGSAVAIGKFDGVHLGHQAILRELRAAAERDGLRSVVFTFAENPLSLLAPAKCPPTLQSREQRLAAFADAGVTDCVIVDFDAQLAGMLPAEFVREVIVERLGARHVLMGEDFRFGARGAGDAQLLQQLGAEWLFAAEVIPVVQDATGGVISSSRIRLALQDGDVAYAAQMLGRNHCVSGTVVQGDRRGREIGFPTANLGGEIAGMIPADGVYAGFVALASAPAKLLPAAISVGNNPTFTPDAASRVEAFILDFDRDIYGQDFTVFFASRLRGMERFASLDELLAQMRADVAQTKQLLAA